VANERELLSKPGAPIPGYPNGFVCGEYSLVATTNMAGITLPLTARYQTFLPPDARSPASATNRISSLREVTLRYFVVTGKTNVEGPDLPMPVDVSDARAVTVFGRRAAVRYRLDRMEIISTNSPQFQHALAQPVALSSTRISQIIKRTAIVFGMILVLLCVILLVWFIQKLFFSRL
jgi:hypothetical protein